MISYPWVVLTLVFWLSCFDFGILNICNDDVTPFILGNLVYSGHNFWTTFVSSLCFFACFLACVGICMHGFFVGFLMYSFLRLLYDGLWFMVCWWSLDHLVKNILNHEHSHLCAVERLENIICLVEINLWRIFLLKYRGQLILGFIYKSVKVCKIINRWDRMQSAGNVSSEDFFEDFMLYSSVEVIMMKLEKRSPIASKNERSDRKSVV